MAWLHTWSGLVIGWALYMMFLAGTAAVFKDEISVWMRPEIPRAADVTTALDLAQRRLMEVAPDGQRWSIALPDDRDPTTQISWSPREPDSQRSSSTREILDSTTGRPLQIRETRGGDLFYRLHYRFEIQGRNGWWLSGAAAVVMLVSLISGVITHKRIFKDFFTFRSRSAPQRAWLDAHLVLAVVLLPFHLVITYTGLVPIMSTVMPWAIAANYAEPGPVAALSNYDQVRSAYSRDLRADPIRRDYTGEYASLVSLADVRSDAERRWGGARIGRINVTNPFDKNSLIEVSRHESGQIANRSERLYFAGDTGAFLGTSVPLSATSQISAVMYGLHMVRFADPALRWIVFIAGLASSAMIAVGLILWVVKRTANVRTADQRIPLGYALVERLNVAGIVGLPIAMAALFAANRLLPVDMGERALAETKIFFAAWLATLVLALIRPRERLWPEQLWMACIAFGVLPLLNAVTTDRHLVASIVSGDWLRAGFDLAMFGCAAIVVQRGKHASIKATRRSRNTSLREEAA
jgi:uncharacterized iron-regulated membrane protein